MAEVSDKQIKEIVRKVIDWANNLSEVWTNTTTGKVLDYKIQRVNKLIKKRKDLTPLVDAANDLASFCKYAEKESDGYEKG